MRFPTALALATLFSSVPVLAQETDSEAASDLIANDAVEMVAPPEVVEVEDDPAPVNETTFFVPGNTLTFFHEAPRFSFPPVAKLVPGRFQHRESNADWQGEGGCTASLIHERVILTAQHCLFDDQWRMWTEVSIRLRETESAPVHTQRVTLSAETVARRRDAIVTRADGTPGWSETNDLALILLPEPVPDAATRVARLARSADLGTFTVLTFVGYGMQLAELPGVAPGPRRLGFLADGDVPMHISAGSYTGRSFRVQATYDLNGTPVAAGVCNGDSGGPVFLSRFEAPAQMVVVGVNHAVTFGETIENCARPDNQSWLVGLIGNRDFIDEGLAKLLPG